MRHYLVGTDKIHDVTEVRPKDIPVLKFAMGRNFDFVGHIVRNESNKDFPLYQWGRIEAEEYADKFRSAVE